MKASYAFLARNALRGLVAALALGGLQVAHAINKGQMGSYRYTPSGNSVSISPNQAGSSGTLAGVTPISTGGNIGTPIGATGWYHGGNAPAGSTTGQTMHMVHGGEVFFAGTKYPFQAGYQVPKSAILDGLGMLCKNPVICLGLSLAAPAITDWLNQGRVGINPNQADYPDKPFTLQTDGKVYVYTNGFVPGKTFGSPQAACSAGMASFSNRPWQVTSAGGSVCKGKFTDTNESYDTSYGQTEISSSPGVLPASLDDIAPYMDKPEVTPNVVRDLLDQGVDIKLPSTPTVTGPTSVPGPTSKTQNPDGSVTTTSTTQNFRTDGNTISNTSTVTTTQTCTGNGSCSPSTTVTTEDPREREKSDCEKNPKAAACQEIDLDTPDGEIPKGTKNVTYQVEDAWGGGACPANVYGSIHGQSMMLYDWGQTCGYVATYLRPMIYLCCALAALFIVMPGKADA